MRGLSNKGELLDGVNGGQVNRIYKRLAKRAELNDEEVLGILGRSSQVGAVQDLVGAGAGIPQVTIRGRRFKVDTLFGYVQFTHTV
mgnify:CR=1 FL=1